MEYNNEFKQAISLLPSKEKDKLILRLLKRDEILSEKLYFELVSTDSVDNVREALEEEIIKSIDQISKYQNSDREIISELRYISGKITRHLKITKDKYGEISLNILMLNKIISQNADVFNHEYRHFIHRLLIYVISRVFKILLLIDKMHEDYHIDFKDGVQDLGVNISKSHNLMKTSIYNNLDVNWLIQYDIPENIQQIYKETRASGLLR